MPKKHKQKYTCDYCGKSCPVKSKCQPTYYKIKNKVPGPLHASPSMDHNSRSNEFPLID